MSLHLRLSAPSSRNETPDRFGLRKVVVAVTEYGKLYGMDSMSGSILWQVRYPGDSLRNSEQQQPAHRPQAFLLVQKDGRTGDYAQAVLVYKHIRWDGGGSVAEPTFFFYMSRSQTVCTASDLDPTFNGTVSRD